MILMAEVYDKHLYNFLHSMLSRKDSEQTVIVVRGDHGLQRGPMAPDFGLQVEHRRPWTEILVPEKLVPSKSALFHNQFRMSTGFDLYNTIRSLISNLEAGNQKEGIPTWSYDLLSELIPLNRTCEEAKVTSELCRRRVPLRDFGVCNPLDKQQRVFCLESKNGKQLEHIKENLTRKD